MPDEKDSIQASLKNVPVKAGQRYRHFKGGEYEIVAVGIKEDTLEPLMIYRSLAKGFIWVRTVPNFTETVEREGKTFKRFTLVAR